MITHMKKHTVVGIAIVIAVVVLYGGLFVNNNLYVFGDDTASIERMIKQKNAGSSAVSFLQIEDFGKIRIAGFILQNGELGYAVFRKSVGPIYEWQSSHYQSASSGFCSFYVPMHDGSDSSVKGVSVTVSNSTNPANSPLAKVKLIINEKCIDEKEIGGTAPQMITIIDNVQANSKAIVYEYYDIVGNRIRRPGTA